LLPLGSRYGVRRTKLFEKPVAPKNPQTWGMADLKPQKSEAPPALDPAVLLIDAKEVVRRLNISGRTWYSLVTTKHAPQPIRLGRRTRRVGSRRLPPT
jgi:predicted DNA-binding transcriptional regulator AlpA